MKRLLGIAALTALTASGCVSNNPHVGYASNEITQYREPLEQAVATNDTDSIADILADLAQKPFPASDYGMGPLVEKAVEVYSQAHYLELVERDDRASWNQVKFDDSCKGDIRQVCTYKTRMDVAHREQMVRAKREKEILAHQRALDSGEAEISSLADARYLLNPNIIEVETLHPKASGGDGRFYEFETYITYQDGRIIYGQEQGAFHVLVNPKIHGNVPFFRPIIVTGRYVGNQNIRLSNGSMTIAAKIVDAHVFSIYYK